jgi:hypothetical protein
MSSTALISFFIAWLGAVAAMVRLLADDVMR